MMKEMFILLIFSFLFNGYSQDLLIYKHPRCTDMYHRYCKVMTPDKCYFGYNKQLCCETCFLYESMYSNQLSEMVCPYGDRNWQCQSMKSNLCYSMYNRYQCCARCAGIRTKWPECRYGDRDLNKCSNIKPDDCYEEDIQRICCGSCKKYETGHKGCKYGDHAALFDKNDRLYTCKAYVGYFGASRCLEKDFSKTCCLSCHNMYKRYFWQWTR